MGCVKDEKGGSFLPGILSQSPAMRHVRAIAVHAVAFDVKPLGRVAGLKNAGVGAVSGDTRMNRAHKWCSGMP
jgi:hypothetical protein